MELLLGIGTTACKVYILQNGRRKIILELNCFFSDNLIFSGLSTFSFIEPSPLEDIFVQFVLPCLLLSVSPNM